MGNILWLIIILIVVGAIFPVFPIARGYQHPAYMGPSLWTLVVILILLRVFGII